MTALILVVDDIPANVKLLEAKLNGEYYDVITAKDGLEAIEMVQKHKPDLILLDVMMPGMDGFETCRQLKANKEVSHIPVVMVTALSEPSDRVRGLEAGADDFITKPINDTALFARVRSLVRMKVLMDELRLRDKTGLDMGVMDGDGNSFTSEVTGAHIVVIDDDMVQCRKIQERFEGKQRVTVLNDAASFEGMVRQSAKTVDLYMINTHLVDADGLRLATHIKSIESERHVPIIMLVEEEDTHLMLKGLELGINDYLVMPIDYNEMQARVKTQIRRKRYQDALKSNYQQSISMAITDKLTGLYNRHYLDTHLNNMVRHALANQKPLSLMIMDMDHFKSVNDSFGHDVGDEVLRQLSQIIIGAVRSSDLAARFGGEEFVVLLPESDFPSAFGMAERMRRTVEEYVFRITHAQGVLNKTLSIGVSTLNMAGDSPEHLIKRADAALYEAKHGGRNRVMPRLEAAAPSGVPSISIVDGNAIHDGVNAHEGAPSMPMQAPIYQQISAAQQPMINPHVPPILQQQQALQSVAPVAVQAQAFSSPPPPVTSMGAVVAPQLVQQTHFGQYGRPTAPTPLVPNVPQPPAQQSIPPQQPQPQYMQQPQPQPQQPQQQPQQPVIHPAVMVGAMPHHTAAMMTTTTTTTAAMTQPQQPLNNPYAPPVPSTMPTTGMPRPAAHPPKEPDLDSGF